MYFSQEKLDSNRLGVPNYPRSEIPAFLLPGVNNASGLQRKYNIILLASTLPRVPCVPLPPIFWSLLWILPGLGPGRGR